MELKPGLARDILLACSVSALSFVAFNIEFLLYALFMNGSVSALTAIFPDALERNLYWARPLLHFVFLALLLELSYFLFKMKVHVVWKSTMLAVVLTSVMVTIGMFGFGYDIVILLLGALILGGVLAFLGHAKKHWLYTYTTIFVGVLMLLMMIFKVEI